MWSCAIKLIVLVTGDIHLMSIVSFFGVSPLKIPLIIIWDAFHFFLLMLFSSSMKCDLILFMFGSYDDHFRPNGIDLGSCLQC